MHIHTGTMSLRGPDRWGRGCFVGVSLCKRQPGLVLCCQANELIPSTIEDSLCQSITMAVSVGSWEQACGGMEPSLMNDGIPFIGIHRSSYLSRSHAAHPNT